MRHFHFFAGFEVEKSHCPDLLGFFPLDRGSLPFKSLLYEFFVWVWCKVVLDVLRVLLLAVFEFFEELFLFFLERVFGHLLMTDNFLIPVGLIEHVRVWAERFAAVFRASNVSVHSPVLVDMGQMKLELLFGHWFVYLSYLSQFFLLLL